MNAPSSHQPLSADWRAWPILPNRKPRRGFDPMALMTYRKDESMERFLIDGADEHHDAICAAVAAALLPMTADPKVRLGRFMMANGPTTTPTIRLEYLEDEWTIFTADLWTSTSLNSALIVVDHWSYMSGSWFGRHLYRHAGGRGISECCLGAFLRAIFTGTAIFFGAIVLAIGLSIFQTAYGVETVPIPPESLFVGLALAFLGIGFAPYFTRRTTADSSLEAQRHLVDRVRQCIYSALAELGIPSSAVHHSTK